MPKKKKIRNIKNGRINSDYIARKVVEEHYDFLTEKYGLSLTKRQMEKSIAFLGRFLMKSILTALLCNVETVLRGVKTEILLIFKWHENKPFKKSIFFSLKK